MFTNIRKLMLMSHLFFSLIYLKLNALRMLWFNRLEWRGGQINIVWSISNFLGVTFTVSVKYLEQKVKTED